MAIGYLQINVFADNIEEPVIGANIEVTGGETTKNLATNYLRSN